MASANLQWQIMSQPDSFKKSTQSTNSVTMTILSVHLQWAWFNPNKQKMNTCNQNSKSKWKSRFGSLQFSESTVYTCVGKIWISSNLQYRIIDWYHTILCNPGVTQMIKSIGQIFSWKDTRAQIEEHIKILQHMLIPQNCWQTQLWSTSTCPCTMQQKPIWKGTHWLCQSLDSMAQRGP